MKNLSSLWQSDDVCSVRLDQLTLCDCHYDDRYLWKILPLIRDEGMRYPLVCWVADLDFYNNKFLKSTPQEMRERLPPPNVIGEKYVVLIKGGNNRYQAAKDLGYDTIDCVIFNTQEDAIRYTRWFAQCDPLENPHLEYKGLFDYK